MQAIGVLVNVTGCCSCLPLPVSAGFPDYYVVESAGHDSMVYCLLQNRYMKAAKDWGWREFVTLHTLFDADAGYLLNDDCVFAAEVLMLRESSEAKQVRLLISASVAILVRTLELQTCSLWLLPLSLLFVLRWAKRRTVK